MCELVEERPMRRTLITTSVVAMLALAACSSSDTGGSASAPAVESAPASAAASDAASPSASASGGTGMVDPASVSGDLTLQGWSAGAVEAPILQQVLDDFQAAYPQVKVKFEPVAGDYPAAMAAKFSSGDVPDVFYVDSGPAATWIDDGTLEPLDDYIATTGVDTSVYYPAYLDAFKGADGKIYGLPKDGNTIAMAYNEDMLTAAGVTAPPTNWEELTAAVDKLKGTEGLDAPLCLSPSLDRALAFIYQAGGGLLTEDKTAAMIDTPESITGIDTYLNFFKSGAAKRPADTGDDWCGKSLGEGHSAIIFEGGWLDPYMKETYPDVKYAWAEMPEGPAGKATLGFTVAYAMGVDSQNKDASWALINYLTGPEGMKTWTEGGVANPSRSDLQGAPGKEILVQGAEYARPWSFIPGFSEINDAFNNAMTGAIEGSGSAQDIATSTKEAIDSNLQ
jgi:multiple sugar transport system substrate-binding protein